jgi:hypothetical protein
MLHFKNLIADYAASEGGAPFVARRAINLHGCALPHLPPFFLLGGYPRERISYGSGGAPPPAAASHYFVRVVSRFGR